MLDAYSSDAIPVHLVTREALALYVRNLPARRAGVSTFRICTSTSSRCSRGLARDAQLACVTRDDRQSPMKSARSGKAPSVWLVMARARDDVAKLAADPRWKPARDARTAACGRTILEVCSACFAGDDFCRTAAVAG